MAADGVTLGLDGVIDVSDFATAVDRFSRLIRALTEEAGADDQVGWFISGLEYGSATLTAAPQVRDEEAVVLADGVVHEYWEVARRVRENPEVDDARPAARYVRELADLTARSAAEVRFETAQDEVVFTMPSPRGAATEAPKALGTVTGRVQTLQARGSLRFTLYDLVRDKAISCFLRAGEEGVMRDVWGHVAEVTGLVTRDPVTDRPRSVRDVTEVRRLEVEHTPGGFTQAEGVLDPVPGAASSEAIIRNLRDAG